MNIVCVFCFPVHGGSHFENACRFVLSYNANPANADHRLVIVSNGGPPTSEMQGLLAHLSHDYEIVVHDGSGWDIGSFQFAARTIPAEMMVFFGTTAYLRGPNWLKRMIEAFDRRGHAALYGSTGNQGDSRVNVFPHVRTTGFWTSPVIINMHPLRVTDPSQRYPYEHGPACLSEWCREQGYGRWVCDWSNEYPLEVADSIPGGFHRDHQQGVIVGDRLTAPPYYAVP